MTRYTSEKPATKLCGKPTLAIVALMGAVSFAISTLSASAFGADLETVAYGAVNANQTIGQKEKPVVFERREAPWMREFTVEGAMENVALPTTFTGTFPYPPLRSLYFIEDGVAYYAYLFPVGKGQGAQEDVRPSDHYEGEQSIVRRGDVIVVAVGGDSGRARTVAERLSPSCRVSTNRQPSDADRTLEGGAVPPQYYISLEGAQPVSEVAQGESGFILPEAFVKSLASELKNTSTAPKHPGSAPTVHGVAKMSNSALVREPDVNGPGCGWDFFGATSPMMNETYVSDINASNSNVIDKRTQEYNDEVQSFNESQKAYVKQWNEWKKNADVWVKWQNEIMNEWKSSDLAKVNEVYEQ